MDCKPQSPLSVALPRTSEECTVDLEEAMNRIHLTFEKEVSGLHKSLRDMDAAHIAEREEAGRVCAGHGCGDFHQGQSNIEGRDPVKAIGDVRRTMHAICQIPKLSHAMLSDFDQWKQEMYNTIASARTNEPKYNQVNIEFIYASIALNLRDQAVGLEPSRLTWSESTRRRTISAKRGKFEGRRQQLTESPMAYLSIMLRLYNRAQYNDQSYLIKRFLAGLLNETLKLQLILHHKQATDYESMRAAVVECHAVLVKAIHIGKGTPTFNVTGLTQQSDVASSETFAQWKRRSKPGCKEGTEPMDLSQIDNLTARNTEVLFFMGQDNLHLRDHETEDDLAYWEDDLASEDTTITEMIRGRADSTDKTCYHCNAVGHFKAQCPQETSGTREIYHQTIYVLRKRRKQIGWSSKPLKMRSWLINIVVTRGGPWSREELRQPGRSRPDH